MKITLHIGQSKTGTSAIQAFLTLNREALLKQSVIYPTISVWGMPIDVGSHNAVADAIMGKSIYPFVSADRYKEEFFREAERLGANHMIISGEHFFGGEPRVWNVASEDEYFEIYRDKVARVAEWFSGHDVSVLVYLRPHAAWFSSAISQTIRVAGLTSTLNANLSDDQFFDLLKPLLRYDAILRTWRDVLKPVDLRIIPYRRDMLIGGSSISDFLHRINVDESQLSHGTTRFEVNTSLTREYLEVKRILNTRKLSRTEVRTAAKCLEALSRKSDQTSNYVPDAVAMARVEALAIEDNALLEASFGVRVDAGSAPKPSPPVTADQISEALSRFETEIRTPKYRRLSLNIWLRTILREHAKPLHTLIHQLKRVSMSRKHKRV